MSNALIIEDMPFADYQALPGINQSTLVRGLRSMSHLRHALDNPREQTAAMALGSAFHVLTTEPQDFEKRYIVGGPINPKTGKPFGMETKAFAEWIEENANGRQVVTQDDFDAASAMASAIRSHPLAETVLTRTDLKIELAIQWTDEDTGVLCKGRLDALLVATRPSIILDLKSTRDASVHGFSRSIWTYGYHIQAAMYSDSVRLAFGKTPRFLFACVESEPPYCSSIHELSREAMNYGRDEYKSLLSQYGQCVMCGNWPGYPADINVVDLPIWKSKEFDPWE